MRLMTNNPAKFIGLKGYGLAVIGRVPVLSPITEENKRYLETKRTKMGHVYGSDLPGNLRRFLNPDAETGDASVQWKGNGNLSEDWFGTYSLFYFIFQLIIIFFFLLIFWFVIGNVNKIIDIPQQIWSPPVSSSYSWRPPVLSKCRDENQRI